MDTSDSLRNIANVFDGPPRVAVARMNLLEAVRATPSSLTDLERLLVAFTASTVNGARADVESLRAELDAIGAPAGLVDSVERAAGRWSVCDDDRLAVIVDYAAKLTRAPAAISADDLQPLRVAALTDLDIVVLNNIVGAYNYVNRARAGSTE